MNDSTISRILVSMQATVKLAVIGVSTASLSLQAFQFHDPIVLESPNAQTEGLVGAGGVDWVPDVNGDGVADILVTAQNERPLGSPSGAGRVYVFDGATQILLRQLRSPNEVTDSNFGNKVAGISDLNGNGSGEAIVGTYRPESRVYVVDGDTGQTIHVFPTRARSLSAVPDVNGDGLPEIVVGFNERIMLYDGASGDQIWQRTNTQLGGTTLMGWGCSGLNDVNGNGTGDIIIGDWRAASEAGRAYVLEGSTAEVLLRLAPTLPGQGQFGRSVTGLNDITGDDRAEIVVSASGKNGNGAYIFDGSNGDLIRLLADPVGDRGLGWVVDDLPDATGDRQDDVLVSGWMPFSAGNAYAFNSVSGGYLATLPGNRDWGSQGTVAGMPDVNGDSLGEVLVANWTATSSGGHANAGHVLLYLSKPLPPTPSLQVTGMSQEAFTLNVTSASISDALIGIDATSDFRTWSQVATITPEEDEIRVTDLEAASHAQRFYRATVRPAIPWRYIAVEWKARTANPDLLLLLTGAGSLYLDDLRLTRKDSVDTGLNHIRNGDFESELSGPWMLGEGYADTQISSAKANSGEHSLRLVSDRAPNLIDGTWISQSVLTLQPNTSYVLRFRFLPTSDSVKLMVRSSDVSVVNVFDVSE